MKYFFSSDDYIWKNLLKDLEVKNILLSWVYNKKLSKLRNWEQYNTRNIIIDSGAFTLWNKGKKVDIDEYKSFLLVLPKHWVKVSLDVIPRTNSTTQEINKCCDESIMNFEYLSDKIENIMPVFHYGEDIKYLKKYIDRTNYIGISPANDTHENIKREFLQECFSITRANIKTHGFGYSSKQGAELFPFFSLDSASFKQYELQKGNNSFKRIRTDKNLWYFFDLKVKELLLWEKYITELWEKKGIHYEY